MGRRHCNNVITHHFDYFLCLLLIHIGYIDIKQFRGTDTVVVKWLLFCDQTTLGTLSVQGLEPATFWFPSQVPMRWLATQILIHSVL